MSDEVPRGDGVDLMDSFDVSSPQLIAKGLLMPVGSIHGPAHCSEDTNIMYPCRDPPAIDPGTEISLHDESEVNHLLPDPVSHNN